MTRKEQMAAIARSHHKKMRDRLVANAGSPTCAYCGIMARNYLHASLLELADGDGLICDRCVREAQRGARMTRDVT